MLQHYLAEQKHAKRIVSLKFCITALPDMILYFLCLHRRYLATLATHINAAV